MWRNSPYLLRISLAPSRFLPPSSTAHTPTKRAPSADGARSLPQGCPTAALGKPRAAVAVAPRAPRCTRSREGTAWAAIGERDVGGLSWGGACVRHDGDAAPAWRLLASVWRRLCHLRVSHSRTKKPLPDRVRRCRFWVFYRDYPRSWHSKPRIDHGSTRLKTWFDRA